MTNSVEKEIVALPVGRKTKQELPLEQTVFRGRHCESSKTFHTDQTIWFVIGKEAVENGSICYTIYNPETHASEKAFRDELIVQRFNSDKTLFSVMKLVEAFAAGCDHGYRLSEDQAGYKAA